MIFQKSTKKISVHFCAMKTFAFLSIKNAISGIFKRYFQDDIIICLSMAALSPLLLILHSVNAEADTFPLFLISCDITG